MESPEKPAASVTWADSCAGALNDATAIPDPAGEAKLLPGALTEELPGLPEEPPGKSSEVETPAAGVQYNNNSDDDLQVPASSSGLSGSPKVMPPGVVWQWKHKEGWQDYRLLTQSKIEKGYSDGLTKVRFKSGKSGQVPMEIFFADMVQFDPTTENKREVRRLGPNSRARRLARRVKAAVRWMEKGSAFEENFDQFQQRRANLRKMYSSGLGSDEQMLARAPSSYRETGCAASIAQSNTFFVGSMLAVLLNAIWVGFEVELNKADESDSSSSEPSAFYIVENVFCCVFVLELVIRFAAFKTCKCCLRDSWFRFDFVIAMAACAETWLFAPMEVNNFVIFRLMRLARLSRVIRLLQVIPEAVTLLKGIARATRSVVVALLMLLLLTYTFAIFFTKQAQRHNDLENIFGSVGRSWLTLWYHGVILDDVADVLYAIEKESIMLTVFFVIFILFSNWTVLNMLIGILCDVVSTVKKSEDERKETLEIEEALSAILECYDGDGDQTISKEEFELLMLNPEVDDILAKFGTDKEGLKILTDITFTDESNRSKPGFLSFHEVIQGVLRMRGEHQVQVTDITELSKYLRQRVDLLEMSLQRRQGELTTQLSEGQHVIKEDLRRGQLHLEELVTQLGQHKEIRDAPPAQAQVLATLKLNFAGSIRSPRMVRHSVSTSIGGVLEQLSEQYGPLCALDAKGITLGKEITIRDLFAGGDLSQAMELHLHELSDIQ